jgi:hypothetical protein
MHDDGSNPSNRFPSDDPPPRRSDRAAGDSSQERLERRAGEDQGRRDRHQEHVLDHVGRQKVVM